MSTEEIVLRAILEKLQKGDFIFVEQGIGQRKTRAYIKDKPINGLQRIWEMNSSGLIKFVPEMSKGLTGAYTISALGQRKLEQMREEAAE